jgi:hypothetical protein
MYFNPKKVAFSRHESFVLRFGWLTKGFRAFEDDPNIFPTKMLYFSVSVKKQETEEV